MRKIYAALAVERVATPEPPGGAGEVTKAVDRNRRRLGKWRDVECGCEMRDMMLDAALLRPHSFSGKCQTQVLDDALALLPCSYSAGDEAGLRTYPQQITDLSKQVGATLCVDCDVVDIAEAHACGLQAIGNRSIWET